MAVPLWTPTSTLATTADLSIGLSWVASCWWWLQPKQHWPTTSLIDWTGNNNANQIKMIKHPFKKRKKTSWWLWVGHSWVRWSCSSGTIWLTWCQTLMRCVWKYFQGIPSSVKFYVFYLRSSVCRHYLQSRTMRSTTGRRTNFCLLRLSIWMKEMALIFLTMILHPNLTVRWHRGPTPESLWFQGWAAHRICDYY